MSNYPFLGVYRCLNGGESLTNWLKPDGLYVKFLWGICRHWNIDKNKKQRLLIPHDSNIKYFYSLKSEK